MQAASPFPAQPQYGAQSTQFGQYEFGPGENVVLEKAAGRTRGWGMVAIGVGSLNLFLGAFAIVQPSLAGNFVSGAIGLVIGMVFFRAGDDLKAVVTTQGNDVPNLMRALNRLSSAFTIQMVVAIIGLLFSVAIFILSFAIGFVQAMGK